MRSLVTTRAMARFRCLGADCEDSCCGDWDIVLDEKHHGLLAGRLAPAELAAGVRLVADDRHALMVLRDDGTCSFLRDDRLCSIQARHGEPFLPDSCSMYPRVIGRIGDRYELSGAISCPEVARQVLLTDDGLEGAAGEPAQFGRGLVSRRIEATTQDDYERSFAAVRGLVIGLLQRRRFPIASRLFFVATLADRTRAQLRRGVTELDAPALQQLGRSLQSDAILDALHEKLQGLETEGPFGISVVRVLLRLPAALVPPRLRDVVDGLARSYAERGAPLDGDLDALQASYRALPPLPERIDVLVERYAVHHVLRDWYVKADSFLGYVHELLARIALIRFVIRSLATEPVDALAVRVIYLVSRMLEHNSELVRRIVMGLEEQGMEQAHAVCLIRI